MATTRTQVLFDSIISKVLLKYLIAIASKKSRNSQEFFVKTKTFFCPQNQGLEDYITASTARATTTSVTADNY